MSYTKLFQRNNTYDRCKFECNISQADNRSNMFTTLLDHEIIALSTSNITTLRRWVSFHKLEQVKIYRHEYFYQGSNFLHLLNDLLRFGGRRGIFWEVEFTGELSFGLRRFICRLVAPCCLYHFTFICFFVILNSVLGHITWCCLRTISHTNDFNSKIFTTDTKF